MTEFVSTFMMENPHPGYLAQWPAMPKDLNDIAAWLTENKSKTILEFGTWEGYTTLMMSKLPDVEKITTVDIYDGFDVAYGHCYHGLRNKEFYGSFIKDVKNVEQVFCDTTKFKTKEKYDAVFIDANHSYESVKNDTKVCLQVNPKIIIWHDYISEQGVSDYINELKSKGVKIVHGNALACYTKVDEHFLEVVNGQ